MSNKEKIINKDGYVPKQTNKGTIKSPEKIIIVNDQKK